eukprot:233989-Chlamydomonas_euryale.AAC.1
MARPRDAPTACAMRPRPPCACLAVPLPGLPSGGLDCRLLQPAGKPEGEASGAAGLPCGRAAGRGSRKA